MAFPEGVSWEQIGTGIAVLVMTVLSVIGKKSADSSPAAPTVSKVVPSTPVEMAALVDSAALNNATHAINALQLTMAKGQLTNKEIAEETVGALKKVSEALEIIAEEIKDLSEASKDTKRAIEALSKDIDRAADGIKLGMMFAAKGSHT